MRKLIDMLFYAFYLYLNAFETDSTNKLKDFWFALFSYFGVCVLTMTNAIAVIISLGDVGKNKIVGISIFIFVFIIDAFLIFHKKHYKSVIEKYKTADKKTLKKFALYIVLYSVLSIGALYVGSVINSMTSQN